MKTLFADILNLVLDFFNFVFEEVVDGLRNLYHVYVMIFETVAFIENNFEGFFDFLKTIFL